MKKTIIKATFVLLFICSAMSARVLAAAPADGIDFIHDSSGNLRPGVTIKGGHKVAITDEAGNTIGWKDDEETVPLRDSYPVRQAIDNKEYSQTFIYPTCFAYYQLDLGQIRPITKIRYLMPSGRDWYFKDAFKIELSNDPEFKDDVGIEDDVVTVYHFFTENKNEVFDEHIADLGNVPLNYRYIRISRNDEPDRDERGIAIAELDVWGYEYTADNYDIMEDAVVTSAEGGDIVVKLSPRSRIHKMDVNLEVGGDIKVIASNNADFENAKVLFEEDMPLGNSEISFDFENTEGYRYLKVTGAHSLLGMEGYPLFDLLADLYISDDGSTVYANARDGGGNILILAEYDGKGKLLNMSKVSGEETASLSYSAQSIYKAFLWTSFDELEPVTKEINLEK